MWSVDHLDGGRGGVSLHIAIGSGCGLCFRGGGLWLDCVKSQREAGWEGPVGIGVLEGRESGE